MRKSKSRRWMAPNGCLIPKQVTLSLLRKAEVDRFSRRAAVAVCSVDSLSSRRDVRKPEPNFCCHFFSNTKSCELEGFFQSLGSRLAYPQRRGVGERFSGPQKVEAQKKVMSPLKWLGWMHGWVLRGQARPHQRRSRQGVKNIFKIIFFFKKEG